MRGDFFLDRGFTKETLDLFQVGFDPIKKRVTIPIRDKDSNLVGVTGRTIVKDFKQLGVQKWLHYKGSSVSNSFFNLNNALQYSKSSDGSIILCEGPSDVMWMWQNGFKNTIGLFCNNITSQKKKILLENFMTVYLFLDGDSGGENGVSSIMEQIHGYFNVFKVNCPTGKDPDNFNKDQIQSLLDSATKLC
jgi:DNA primase